MASLLETFGRYFNKHFGNEPYVNRTPVTPPIHEGNGMDDDETMTENEFEPKEGDVLCARYDSTASITTPRKYRKKYLRGVAELRFSIGDNIILHAKHESGWWLGKLVKTGAVGWFPPDSVVPINAVPSTHKQIEKVKDIADPHPVHSYNKWYRRQSKLYTSKSGVGEKYIMAVLVNGFIHNITDSVTQIVPSELKEMCFIYFYVESSIKTLNEKRLQAIPPLHIRYERLIVFEICRRKYKHT
eukprot:356423_1